MTSSVPFHNVAMLNDIQYHYNQLKEKYDNYEQRAKRKDFYLKNGFKEMDFYFIEFGVRYEMLYTGKRLPSQYFDELMFHYVGEKYKEYRVFD